MKMVKKTNITKNTLIYSILAVVAILTLIYSALHKDKDGYFKNQFEFSRAFVGSLSVAGSDNLTTTAHEAFEMLFGDFFDIGGQHFDVIKSYNRMLIENEIYNNAWDINAQVSGDMLMHDSVGKGNKFEG